MASSRAAAIVILTAWVLATRLWLIKAAGSAIPFWDQWGAEAVSLYRPWLDGTLRWADLIAPHNEHRILLTRLADLALFAAAGGWNPWFQLILNAVLHALTAGALLALFWGPLPPLFRSGLLAILAVVFAVPAGWQNALWGFQSQVYFGNVLTVAAIAGLCGPRPLSLAWWCGWIAAGLALFTNAGGLLASVAALTVNIIAFTALRWSSRAAREGRGTPAPSPMRITTSSPPFFTALVLIGLVVAVGIALQVHATHHDPLQPRTVAQFLSVLLHCLAWPNVNRAFWAIVMLLPLSWWMLDHFRHSRPLGPLARCALALGVFALLHAAAVAYSRGAGLMDDRPLSRYQDPLLLGISAQAFAGLALARDRGLRGRLALMGWLTALALGLVTLTETNLSLNLPYKRAHDAASVANLQDYAVTHDATLLHRTFGLAEPPENPELMRQILDEPRLRAVLPQALFSPHAQTIPGIARVALPAVIIAGVILLLAIAALATNKTLRSKRGI
jgi:hypothetical protein